MNMLYLLAAPAAHLWLDRGDDESIRAVIQRWQQDIDWWSHTDEAPTADGLRFRRDTIMSTGFSLIAYLFVFILLTIAVGVSQTLWGNQPQVGHEIAFQVIMILTSALVGLAASVGVKAAIAQRQWRTFQVSLEADKHDYHPPHWSNPNNTEFLLAVPVILAFASIWWGR